MKADLTRSTFRPERHYSGVRMQQGRVQLDADWNEQVDIGTYLDETTRIDVIGRCGMPEDNAGFEVTPAADGSDLLLSPGRAYVDGIPCESDASPIAIMDVGVSEAKLASFVTDGRELEAGDWIQLSATGVGPFTARIDSLDPSAFTVVFEPALSAANADALEKAKDPVVRRQASYLTQPDFPGVRPSKLEDKVGTYLAYLDVWERHVTALEDGGIREVALGGPDTSTRTQTVWQVKLERLGEPEAEITCATVPDWSEFIDQSTALLRARAQPETTSSDPCTIPPGAGFRRLENQLYRVEIHDGGNVSTATFKWSRENGSVVVAASVTDTDELTVASTGRDEVLGIAPGNWVELTDGTHELAGEPGTLVKVKSIAGNVLTVDTTASGPLDPAEFPSTPKVRRWDDANGPRKVTVPGTNQGFLALEDGVEVRFEPGRRYASGDYWLIPARTATGAVEWPKNGGSPATPLGRPPDGIRHHYCALALLRLSGEKWEVAEDCRKLFPPLTGLHGLQQDPGIHVVRVRSGQQDPLRNDTDLLLRDFVKGIEVLCDQVVEPGTLANKPTMLLTLDLPFPMSSDDQTLWGRELVGTMPLTLNGIVQAQAARIRWLPTEVVSRWLLGRVSRVMQAAKIERLLLHLTLKGNFVYDTKDTNLNVDGEAFGILRDGTLDVSLPSGDGRRGGNLDLWFWLRARPAGRTDRLVLVPVLRARRLTTIARRSALATSVGFAVDRTKLMAALPETFTIDTRAETDPERARTAVSRLRLAAETVVRIAVEEEVAAAADVIFAELEENNVALQIVAVTVADVVESFEDLLSSAAGIDGVLASEETVARLAEAHPDQVDMERALRF
jgi:Family of unknown function (DUF6519)